MNRYGMRLRPLGIGCQPEGFTNYTESNKKQSGFYGILDYEDPLTAEEIKRFELEPINILAMTPGEQIETFIGEHDAELLLRLLRLHGEFTLSGLEPDDYEEYQELKYQLEHILPF